MAGTLGDVLDNSLGGALAAAAGRLIAAGIESARLDARLLASLALGWEQGRVLSHPEHSLSPEQHQALDTLVARREAREPMAAITGQCEFWSLDFTVTKDVLVPRPDSETLVEAALAFLTNSGKDRDAELEIIDFGTGTGCLLLALLSELPRARGLGVDLSEAALDVAAGNAGRLNLDGRARFQRSDWDGDVDAVEGGRFDLAVANPPYIADPEFDGLEPEIARYEPRLALSGGADGLDCYQKLAPGLSRLLKPEGRTYLEIGATQADAVSRILRRHELETVCIHKDLSGLPRVIEAAKEF
ncbi:MAG TPA: peptide chain release factor N(5)-glutamine methyltransferase [Rhodospirillales bacterium]|nr:peptide chain release factor N(5)-glutamine methyltransferase [Rhodospirillales bacterium]